MTALCQKTPYQGEFHQPRPEERRDQDHVRRQTLAIAGKLVGPILFSFATACGSPATEIRAAEAPSPKTDVDFFPLKNEHAYLYETLDEATGRSGVLVVEIERSNSFVKLKTGNRTQRLEVRPDGVYNINGGYVLKYPLAIGASWRGVSGVVTVTETDVALETAAGSFTRCLVTLERSSAGAAPHSIRSTFCPDVGMVELVVEALGVEPRRESARLRSFGPKIDVESH